MSAARDRRDTKKGGKAGVGAGGKAEAKPGGEAERNDSLVVNVTVETRAYVVDLRDRIQRRAVVASGSTSGGLSGACAERSGAKASEQKDQLNAVASGASGGGSGGGSKWTATDGEGDGSKERRVRRLEASKEEAVKLWEVTNIDVEFVGLVGLTGNAAVDSAAAWKARTEGKRSE